MSVSALAAVRHVVEEYEWFLRTSFRFLDPHLRQQFEEHLRGMDVLVRGPYVTLARDFARGARLRDLAAEGVLDPGIVRAAWPFGNEPLYLHRERPQSSWIASGRAPAAHGESHGGVVEVGDPMGRESGPPHGGLPVPVEEGRVAQALPGAP